MSSRLPMLICCVLVGCSASDVFGTEAPDDFDSDNPGGDLGEVDDTSAPLPTAWGLTGTIALVDGAIDAMTPGVVFSTRDASCDVPAASLTATAVAPADMPDDLLHVFEIEAELSEDATCTFRGPTTVRLGIGPTDAALQPSADRAGVVLDRMHGLYLSAGTDDLLLVGVIGTQDQIDGTTPPATEGPVPDGTYQLITMFGIPLTR